MRREARARDPAGTAQGEREGVTTLNLRRLEIIREVARNGSFRAAAVKLGLTPSAISQQIAQLEREVGVTLVDHDSTGVVLTPAGRALVDHANAILARASEAEHELRQLVEGTAGRLRVAAFSSAAAALMPDAIVLMREAQPHLEIEMTEQERAPSLDQIRAGDLDLAIVARRGDQPPELDDGQVERIPLLDDVIDVLLPAGHPYASRPSVRLEDLADEDWADCYGTPLRHAMAELGVEPNVVIMSDNHAVLQSIVSAGIGVSLFPRLAQGVLRPDVIVKPIVPRARSRLVEIAVRRDEDRPAALPVMVDVLRGVADRWKAQVSR